MNRVKPWKPPQQRQEPIRDREYLDYLRTCSCVISGRRGDDVDPAHIGTLGRGVKFHDWGALPLDHDLHMTAHQMGELSFWRENLSDDDLRAALRAWAHEMYREWKTKNRPSPNE